MPKADYEYFASLNDQQVLAVLLRIEKNMTGLEKKGSASFNKISKSAGGMSSFMSGAVTGAVMSVTNAFINMATSAVSSIGDIISRSIELNSNLEQATITFENIFKDKKAADQFIDFLKETSTQLGISTDEATMFAKSLVPDTSSLEQFNELLRVGTTLAVSQGKSMEDARFAIEEAITGDFISLKERMGIPKEVINQIKETGKEIGLIPALIQVLDERFQKTGVSIESFSDTYAATINRAKSQTQDLQTSFGAPIFDELKEQVAGLGDFISDNKDDLEVFADAMGRVVASVVDFVGTNLNDFLQSLSMESMIDLAENIFDLVENAQLLSDIIFGVEFDGSFIDDINYVVEKLNEAAITAAKIGAIVKAEKAKSETFRQELAARSTGPGGALGGLFGSGAASEEDIAEANRLAQEAYNKVIMEAVGLLEENQKAKDDNRQATEDLKDAQKEATGSTDELEQAFEGLGPQVGDTTDEMKEALEKVAKAQEKMADIQRDFDRDVEDAYKDHARAMAKLDEDIAQKRVDEAKDNARAIEDIYRKNTQDLEDAAKDWDREQQDIARDQLRAQEDLAKESAKERIKVEEDYQKKIKDINRQFAYEIQDAEENQDALAFIAAVKKRERAVEEAQTERTEQKDETEKGIQERQAVLAMQRERELEDARIAHERELADLQVNLERELQAQQLNHERELEDIAVYEERKRAELALSLEQELADAAEARDRKIEDLRASLDEEILALLDAENAKTELMRQEAEERIRIAQEEARAIAEAWASIPAEPPGAPTPTETGPGGNTPRMNDFQITPIPLMAGGGRLRAGSPAFIGENGPELFIPDVAGRIIPNHQMGSYISQGGGRSVTNNSYNPAFSLYNPATLTPEQMMITRSIAEQMAVNVVSRLVK